MSSKSSCEHYSETPVERSAYHPKVIFVVTAAVSTIFFRRQCAYHLAQGLRIEIVSSPGPQLDAMRDEGVNTIGIPMEREICLPKDVVALWRLWRLFRRSRPDLVVSGTPKAGLLGALAARIARVPRVVYSLHGLRMETARGWKRALLWSAEWLSCHLADLVISVSPSLRKRVICLGLVRPDRCHVIAKGTSNGIDVERWRRTLAAEVVGQQTRESLGIPRHARVVGFVGRFTRDKGIPELYEAFSRLRQFDPGMRLLLVGDFEDGDPIAPALRATIEADSSVVRTGFLADVEGFYWAMDVLALPTHREGFPGVPLEAQGASVPVVTTDATGAVDAIVDGVTGIRVPVGDVDSLTAALTKLLGDVTLRRQMGEAGRAWVEENFRRELVWKKLLAAYRSILQSAPPRSGHSAKWLKRVVDYTIALPVLFIASPLWVVAAIAVRLTLGSPVLFRQVRAGSGGRPFTLVKFRTMRDARDANGNLLDDDARLTWLGRFLRSFSIDELPQLWNVLRGDMSLVGPRPLLMKYLDRYTAEQARRHEVLPGITGWAQVNGRNALSWNEKFALDVWYVDHWSVRLDYKILWLTLLRVLKREGVCSQGHATMPEFMGSPSPGEDPS